MKPILVALVLFCTLPIESQRRPHDVELPDITVPQPALRVVDTETSKEIATQAQAMKDMNERLGKIDDNIKEIKTDVKTLTETNVIVNFLLGASKVLFPGMIITAFGIWLTKILLKDKPTRKPKAA